VVPAFGAPITRKSGIDTVPPGAVNLTLPVSLVSNADFGYPYPGGREVTPSLPGAAEQAAGAGLGIG
jgi:hypothetical protein